MPGFFLRYINKHELNDVKDQSYKQIRKTQLREKIKWAETFLIIESISEKKVGGHDDQHIVNTGGQYSFTDGHWPLTGCYLQRCSSEWTCQEKELSLQDGSKRRLYFSNSLQRLPKSLSGNKKCTNFSTFALVWLLHQVPSETYESSNCHSEKVEFSSNHLSGRNLTNCKDTKGTDNCKRYIDFSVAGSRILNKHR